MLPPVLEHIFDRRLRRWRSWQATPLKIERRGRLALFHLLALLPQGAQALLQIFAGRGARANRWLLLIERPSARSAGLVRVSALSLPMVARALLPRRPVRWLDWSLKGGVVGWTRRRMIHWVLIGFSTHQQQTYFTNSITS
jgi:hypothetical protein